MITKLPNVDLIAATDTDVTATLRAIDKCKESLDFHSTQLLTNLGLDSIVKYSKFILLSLHNYITTSHVLICQHDGYVVQPELWDSNWLRYDYIGAPVQWTPWGLDVGNGGFSLRSAKLCALTAENQDMFENDFHLEDWQICIKHRSFLESKGILFAPYEVARNFSYEPQCGFPRLMSFGIHTGGFQVSV